jgi:molecular chaperone GrpE
LHPDIEPIPDSRENGYSMTKPVNGAHPQSTDDAQIKTDDHADLKPVDPKSTEPAAAPDPLVTLEAEKADLKDKLLRALAEMENLRRRTEKDLADARAYGVTRFARDMLDVADNLRRAQESVPAETRETADGFFKAMLDGVDLTERDLLKKMETHGVRKQNPEGQKFDPNLHQAIFEIPDDTKPNGTVLQVVQSGYVIGDRVLRPAMVGVSKGGPKAAPSEGVNKTA